MSLRLLPLALLLAALMALFAAAPASAATTGTVCGQVTAFTAPTLASDGSITIDGTVEVIDQSAEATLDAQTIVVLQSIAAMNATTCLDIVANLDGDIIELSIATQAQICGGVTLDAVTGVYSVAGVAIPEALVAADAELQALLDAAFAADAEACLNVTVSGTTGLITSVSLTATFDLCGTVEAITNDSVTINGVVLPMTLFDANATAVLSVAAQAEADVCAQLVIVNTNVTAANLAASLELCAEVVLTAEGDVVIDGVLVPSTLLSAELLAVLGLAADADVVACLWIDATSTNGTTSVVVDALVEICATVDAVGDTTVTIGDVVFQVGADVAAALEVGDVICLTVMTDNGAIIVVDVELDADGTPPGPPAPAPADPPAALPDTAVPASGSLVGLAGGLLMLSMIGFSAARRYRS